MSKIYTFLIIVPLIAIFFFKAAAFYEYDTKQRYIKNLVDNSAHKVMITGVMTESDREELLVKLQKLSDFKEGDILLKCGKIQSDGSISSLDMYVPGNVLNRGEVFGIYVQSKEESTVSRMEGESTDDSSKLFFKAKAICRIEKCLQVE